MKLVSIDPSSTCTGYAVLDRSKSLKLVEAGRLRGKKDQDAIGRMFAMREQLLEVLSEFAPQVVIIEMVTEKQHTREPGKKSGLPIWGEAAGLLCGAAMEHADLVNASLVEASHCTIYPISNIAWTRGKNKDERQMLVLAMFPHQYNADSDSGQDMSDAIAMAIWYDGQCRKSNLLVK
jgi:Holliday junction resolvasome RuvABC endonuclease subunit